MNSQYGPETHNFVIEEVTRAFRIFDTNFELTSLRGPQVARYGVSTGDEFARLATEGTQTAGVEIVILRSYR